MPGAKGRHIELDSAINETTTFRFSIYCGAGAVRAPQFSVAPLASTQGAMEPTAVRVFRTLPVQVSCWPGWHIRAIPPAERVAAPWDVLVPLHAPVGGLPKELKPNEAYHFWADVLVPKGTPPGEYASELVLRSGSAVIDRIPLRVTVRPFVLPDAVNIDVITDIDHRALIAHHAQRGDRPSRLTVDGWRGAPGGDDSVEIVKSVMRMLRSHGLTPVLPALMPIVQVTAHDRVDIDWHQFGQVVDECLNGTMFFDGLPLRRWPLPVAAYSSPASPAGSGSPWGRSDWLRSYFASCAGYFNDRGWLDRTYVALPDGGTGDGERNEWMRTLIGLARDSDPAVPILSSRFPQDLGPFGWIDFRPDEWAGSVDIWMPPGQYFDAEVMSRERAAGRRTWMSVDRPPFSGSLAIQARPSDARVLSWQAAALDAEVIHVGCVNRWPDAASNPAPTDCVRFDASTLIYPGGPFGLDEPVASVRLKYLRRSLQDAAYLQVLRDRGLDYVATALRESLVSYAGTSAYRTHFLDGRPIGWPERMETFETARQIMLEELTRNAAGEPADNGPAFIQRTAAWRRLMATTRTPELFVEGARVRPESPADALSFEIEILLTVVNKTRSPLTGSARILELPDGWTGGDATALADPVARGGRGRIRLIARAAGLPVAPGGCLEVPVEFTAEDGGTYRTRARVACVSVIPAARPMRIDGDLSEWPLGSTNQATTFRLISAGSADAADSNRSRPRFATGVRFVRDDRFLYVTVTAEASGTYAAANANRNQVTYEDMVPVGEELIEVLIDPDNSGSRSPTDLYRIVVKRNGSYLCERGLRSEPPCAQRRPWAVDLDIATTDSEGGWMAELRIPLAAFDRPAEHTLWGLNVVRFDEFHKEFSTWSGAYLNAYDPLSLGNLYLP